MAEQMNDSRSLALSTDTEELNRQRTKEIYNRRKQDMLKRMSENNSTEVSEVESRTSPTPSITSSHCSELDFSNDDNLEPSDASTRGHALQHHIMDRVNREKFTEETDTLDMGDYELRIRPASAFWRLQDGLTMAEKIILYRNWKYQVGVKNIPNSEPERTDNNICLPPIENNQFVSRSRAASPEEHELRHKRLSLSASYLGRIKDTHEAPHRNHSAHDQTISRKIQSKEIVSSEVRTSNEKNCWTSESTDQFPSQTSALTTENNVKTEQSYLITNVEERYHVQEDSSQDMASMKASSVQKDDEDEHEDLTVIVNESTIRRDSHVFVTSNKHDVNDDCAEVEKDHQNTVENVALMEFSNNVHENEAMSVQDNTQFNSEPEKNLLAVSTESIKTIKETTHIDKHGTHHTLSDQCKKNELNAQQDSSTIDESTTRRDTHVANISNIQDMNRESEQVETADQNTAEKNIKTEHNRSTTNVEERSQDMASMKSSSVHEDNENQHQRVDSTVTEIDQEHNRDSSEQQAKEKTLGKQTKKSSLKQLSKKRAKQTEDEDPLISRLDKMVDKDLRSFQSLGSDQSEGEDAVDEQTITDLLYGKYAQELNSFLGT